MPAKAQPTILGHQLVEPYVAAPNKAAGAYSLLQQLPYKPSMRVRAQHWKEINQQAKLA
jgi:hypothetical protein